MRWNGRGGGKAILALVLVLAAPGSHGRAAGADAGILGTYRRGAFELTFGGDGRYRVSRGGGLGIQGRYEVSGDTAAVTDDGGPMACPASVTGRYRFQATRDGLTLTAIADPCDGRREGFSGGPWPRVAEEPLVLTHATVIDGTGAPPRADMTLVLADGKIADLAPTGAKPLPPGATVLDLTGRYVIPGLIDTHVHLATDPSGEERRASVERRLRNGLYGGVTAVRDMAGDGRALADLARAALVGDIESPAIYYAAVMGGPDLFTDPRVRSSSQGVTPGTAPWARAITSATDWRLAVAEAKGAGAVGIKLYADVPAALLAPLAAEAHRQGLRVWAHAALFPARPSDAVRAGVDVLSHASLLVWEAAPSLPDDRQRMRGDYAGVSTADPRIAALVRLMAERGTLLDATLYVLRDQTDALAWSAAVTNEAFAAGVGVTAGTDDFGGEEEGALPNIHEELQLLVEKAGLSPLAALAAGTRNGARALGIEAIEGTVAVGKTADLVVLSSDPTADIRHTRDIVCVFRGGKRYAKGS